MAVNKKPASKKVAGKTPARKRTRRKRGASIPVTAINPEQYVTLDAPGMEYLFGRTLNHYTNHTAGELLEQGCTEVQIRIIDLVLAKRGLKTLPYSQRHLEQATGRAAHEINRIARRAIELETVIEGISATNRADTILIAEYGRMAMRRAIRREDKRQGRALLSTVNGLKAEAAPGISQHSIAPRLMSVKFAPDLAGLENAQPHIMRVQTQPGGFSPADVIADETLNRVAHDIISSVKPGGGRIVDTPQPAFIGPALTESKKHLKSKLDKVKRTVAKKR